MRVVLIGAGALGQLFAYCLVKGGAEVRFLANRERDRRETLAVTLARSPAEHVTMQRAAEGGSFDYAVLAVRADQIDLPTLTQLTPFAKVPLLALTPLLPAALAHVENVVETVIPSMPSVAVRFDANRRLAYWCPPLGPSLVQGDARRGVAAPLIRALRAGGLPIRTGGDVASRNWATTMTFFPLQMAVCCAGGLRAWLDDEHLFGLSMRAARECRRLARRLGTPDPGIVALTFVAPVLRWARSLLHAWFPAAFSYVDHHFGHKLVAQHRTLLAEIEELGRQHDVPTPSLVELSDHLPPVASGQRSSLGLLPGSGGRDVR